MFKHWPVWLALVGALVATGAALAEKQYGPGVSDTEIKLGNTRTYLKIPDCCRSAINEE